MQKIYSAKEINDSLYDLNKDSTYLTKEQSLLSENPEDQVSFQGSMIDKRKEDGILERMFKNCLFGFGSYTLAIIYMANTMVIPDMNEIQNEVNFEDLSKFILSLSIYFMILFSITIPGYLAIVLCNKLNCPFFTQIIKKYNGKIIMRIFVQANIGINFLCLITIIIKLILSGINCVPFLYLYIQNSFDTTFIINDIIVILSFYLLFVFLLWVSYKYSYFEHFHHIQYRLILSLLFKWLLMWAIFIAMQVNSQCEPSYIIDDKYLFILANLFPSAKQNTHFTDIVSFYSGVCHCLSFPFLEIFIIKKEVQPSTYKNVQKAYQGQILMRILYLFQQVLFWGILYQQNQLRAFNCYYSVRIQIIVFVQICCAMISLVSIYANNIILNQQLLAERLMEAQVYENMNALTKLFKSLFIIATIATIIAMGGIYLYSEFWKFYILVQSIMGCTITFLFGVCCIIIPLLTYFTYHLNQLNSSFQKNILRVLIYLFISITFMLFLVVLVNPLIKFINN